MHIRATTGNQNDAVQRIAHQTQTVLDVFQRAWAPVIKEIEHSIQEAGRALGEHMERLEQRWRVRNLMPRLTMREVLTHGYVAYKDT